MKKRKLLRITTVPQSLHLLLNGQFRFMRENGFDVLTASADGAEIRSIEQEGVPHQVIPFTRKITPLRDLLCVFYLVRLMRKFRPDIVHTHTPKAGLLGMIAAWIARVPVRLHTVAGLPYMESTGLKKVILRITELTTYRFATMVYPNSIRMKKFIVDEFGVAPSRLRVIGNGSSNGINTELFKRSDEVEASAAHIRQQHNMSKDQIVFSFVGRIVRDKGISELVSAFRAVAQSYRCRLVLVGAFESDLDPLPEDTMSFLQKDPRVVLAGFQRDVRPWIAAADIFVFPSYREGFPNVVMQAGALEVPMIATDINGCNELITEGESGMLVPVKDDLKLAEAMQSLAADSNKRKVFGIKSRELIVSKFDQRYFWNELLKEYNLN